MALALDRRAGEAGGVPPWPRCWPLLLGGAAVVVLAAAGLLPTWPGLLHLVALPPVDLFADLRVLLPESAGWPQFLLLLALVLAVRIAVLAYLMGGLDRPRLRFAALFYAIALPLLAVAAFLDAVAYAVLYSRLFWPAVTVVAVVASTYGPAPWQGTVRMRTAIGRSWRRGLRLEVTLPYAAAVLALGALADRVPALTLPLVPVSALATVLAIRALARPPRGPVARHPLRVLAAFATVLLVSTAYAVLTPREDQPAPAAARDGAILIMSGINSSSGSGAIFSTEVDRLGYGCDQVYYFSYAGPGGGQPQGEAPCPIRTGAPYEPEDTQRPFAEQVEAFLAQTADLPRPLVVAGHSHAVWVAWEAIGSGGARVDELVLVGPFPDSPIGYPPAGEPGEGRVFGDLLRAATPLADAADFRFDPDAPAARELLATENAAAGILARPLPAGTRALSVTSITDLPLMPSGWRLPVERNACPARASHPLLPQQPVFHDEVIRFLEQRPARPCPPWRDWGGVLARPFGIPW